MSDENKDPVEKEVGEGEASETAEAAAETEEAADPCSAATIAEALSQMCKTGGRSASAFTKLDFSKRGLSGMKGDLALFQELRHVDFSDNELSSMDELAPLTNVVAVNLQRNKLTTFGKFGLDNEKLIILQVDQNEIESFEDFNMPSLRCLSIANNKLLSLESLEMPTTPAIEMLNLANNHLTTLVSLDRLPELTDLSVAGNQITSLDGIETCHKLRSLDISNNQLPTWQEFKKLSKLEHFTKLIATGNQGIYDSYDKPYEVQVHPRQLNKQYIIPEITNTRSLLVEVVLMLPKLEYFDDIKIDSNVRIEANQVQKQRDAELALKQAAEFAEAEAARAMAEAQSNRTDRIDVDVTPLNLDGIAPDGGVQGLSMPADAMDTAMSTNITEKDIED